VPTALIVDDNEKNLKLARDVLRFAGFRTLEAATGGEGVSLAVEHLPDVILMDIRLPDMDGTDAARQLKVDERTARIPIVALTSLAMIGRSRVVPVCGLRRLPREADQRPRAPRSGA